MHIEKILARLSGVRQVGAAKWKACCPAHDDKSPSFQVTEFPSGKIGIHCWSGCDKSQILKSLGLKWADLDPDGQRKSLEPRQSFDLETERLVVAIAQADIKARKRLSDEDKARYKLAKLRLSGRFAA